MTLKYSFWSGRCSLRIRLQPSWRRRQEKSTEKPNEAPARIAGSQRSGVVVEARRVLDGQDAVARLERETHAVVSDRGAAEGAREVELAGCGGGALGHAEVCILVDSDVGRPTGARSVAQL